MLTCDKCGVWLSPLGYELPAEADELLKEQPQVYPGVVAFGERLCPDCLLAVLAQPVLAVE